MPRCKNAATRRYRGDEPSPTGLGWCAHAEKGGSERRGKDGQLWRVARTAAGVKRWVRVARGRAVRGLKPARPRHRSGSSRLATGPQGSQKGLGPGQARRGPKSRQLAAKGKMVPGVSAAVGINLFLAGVGFKPFLWTPAPGASPPPALGLEMVPLRDEAPEKVRSAWDLAGNTYLNHAILYAPGRICLPSRQATATELQRPLVDVDVHTRLGVLLGYLDPGAFGRSPPPSTFLKWYARAPGDEPIFIWGEAVSAAVPEARIAARRAALAAALQGLNYSAELRREPAGPGGHGYHVV